MADFTVDVKAGLLALYNDFRQREQGGWREVGQLLKVSGAYARQLAEGERPITLKIARRYLELNLTPTVQRSRKPAHRPYIESDAMWNAYQKWAAEWRKTQEEQP